TRSLIPARTRPAVLPPSLHDALPICAGARVRGGGIRGTRARAVRAGLLRVRVDRSGRPARDPAARGGRAVARRPPDPTGSRGLRSEEHTSELQSHLKLVCRLPLEKEK